MGCLYLVGGLQVAWVEEVLPEALGRAPQGAAARAVGLVEQGWGLRLGATLQLQSQGGVRCFHAVHDGESWAGMRSDVCQWQFNWSMLHGKWLAAGSASAVKHTSWGRMGGSAMCMPAGSLMRAGGRGGAWDIKMALCVPGQHL